MQDRRTFAIISHPDAGKTTLTEKCLLWGRAIALAGTVKGKKSSRHATSDWMALEQERGISVTTSVMQFPYGDCTVNLLDTPGHADFSEDTYRTLTAVDSAWMVIDAAKGVEARTIKLMEVCRLRDTPIMTFINKLDRESRDPFELIDDIEKVLTIDCTPITWPISSGRTFKGVYHLIRDEVICFEQGHGEHRHTYPVLKGLHSDEVRAYLAEDAEEFYESIELLKEATAAFDLEQYLAGLQTPVFFGTALGNFGIEHLLDDFVAYAPSPRPREAETRVVEPTEPAFTGVVFKIQANMDPKHRDRVAFVRVCSGAYKKGKKIKHVRLDKTVQIASPLTFLAGDRAATEEVVAGDIVGFHNHGTIQIGDTFTEGENLTFKGVPNFAPELFKRVVLADPLKMKALIKGLTQLSEEGATQVFRPIDRNDLILGAVGVLQFDVVAHRLLHEYQVKCSYEPVNVALARWVSAEDPKDLEAFKRKTSIHLYEDAAGYLTYLASSRANLAVMEERYSNIEFTNIRDRL